MSIEMDKVDRRMNLLVVMVRYPFPAQSGGSIVAANSIQRLSKLHRIHFLCLGEQGQENELSDFVDKAEFVISRKLSIFSKIFRYILCRLSGNLSSAIACKFRELRARVSELMDSENFDAIVLFELEALQCCAPRFYKKVVVNIEDPYSLKLIRMQSLSVWSLWQRVARFFDGLLTRHYERSVLPRLGKVLLLSAADAQDMRLQGKYENLGCVTYGVNKQSVNTIDFADRTGGMIVFSGNMHHLPNVDGILYFLRNVFPLVLHDVPYTTLWIVGSNPDRRIYDVAGSLGEHVVITGKVDDVSEYLRQAVVSICPVRLKVGVQTKILEALTFGTPVVTTSAGNSGIAGRSGEEMWVEDDPRNFAFRVVSLLRGENWSGLSENGRKLVEDRFTWDRSAEELEQHIKSNLAIQRDNFIQ
jgi:glycosyltransferase involved in cell wall biosynthesis